MNFKLFFMYYFNIFSKERLIQIEIIYLLKMLINNGKSDTSFSIIFFEYTKIARNLYEFLKYFISTGEIKLVHC